MTADCMRPLVALVLLGALLAAGCSDAFDPFVESDQRFALYGFLDARQDTQFVRVQPITGQEAVAATRVTSTVLATGEQIVWRDSLLRLDDGALGTVYVAAFRPEPGLTYRVGAVSPEAPDVGSTAEIRVPAEAALRVAAPRLVGGLVTQVLGLESPLRPRDVRITYTVRRVGGEPIVFSFDYTARPATSGGGFEVLVSLLRNAEDIQSRLNVDPEEGERLALLDLSLTYDLVDERGGIVMGGPGALGAAAGFEAEWTLTPQAVAAIGFVDAQGRR